MSRYEWDSGTIVLPAAEVTAVKRAVKNAADGHLSRLYDEAQKFWAALPRRCGCWTARPSGRCGPGSPGWPRRSGTKDRRRWARGRR
jgi:hypothetical protein